MLEHLGLEAGDEAVYRALLDGPATVDVLARRTAREVPGIRAALDRLLALGLASDNGGAPGEFTPRPPGPALAAVQRAREEELAARSAELVAGRDRLVRFLAGVTGDQSSLVETVDGNEAVGRRVHEIVGQARHALRILDRPPYVYNSPETGSTLAQELELLAAGVTVRVLYEAATFEPPDLSSCLATSIARGEQARVMNDVPIKLSIVDESAAIIPAIPAPGETGRAVVLHTPLLVEPLVALFDSLWAHAIPVGPQDVHEPVGMAATPDERVLLTLLAAGLKDGAIARHLGTSERTVNRRISELSARLDAQSRFQAGLQAARRGWL